MEYRPAWYEAHFEKHKAIFKRQCDEPVRINWQKIRNCTQHHCTAQGHNKIHTYKDLAKWWRVPTKEQVERNIPSDYQLKRLFELEAKNRELKAKLAAKERRRARRAA